VIELLLALAVQFLDSIIKRSEVEKYDNIRA
jgi:hypothetical protein